MAEDEEENGAEEEKPSGGIVQKAMTAVGLFVLMLAALIVAPFINNAIHGPPGAVTADEEVEEVEVEEEIPPEDLAPAIYTPLDPPMVINFDTPEGSTRFLQMSVQAMARDQATIDAVKNHLPAIRNNFLFLISNTEYQALDTVEGKEQLRAELLTEAQSILQRNGDPAELEAVYFTSFVMQ